MSPSVQTTLSLQTIEDIAPDQASLSAAKKLLSANKWQGQGFCPTTHTAWGECQGSGSKPYYVVVDVVDIGYKCTCPSRKFPCKHALALMWRYVSDSSPFIDATTPEWVSDWLGRRRKTKTVSTDTTTDAATRPKKSIALTDTDEQKADIDPKKQAAAQKRSQTAKANTDAQISTGLQEFAKWLEDQVHMGVGAFLDHAHERCRQGASRLVDAKATALSSVVDELPALLLNTPKTYRANRVLGEFGRWYLLMMAWQKTPDDPDVRRAIIKAEDKQVVLDDPNALSVMGTWQVVGERTQTRKDGLISQAVFLVKVADDTKTPQTKQTPNVAMLQDFYHPTSGIKHTSQLGAYMTGRLVYYPSAVPYRAFFDTVQTLPRFSQMYYDPNTDNPNADDHSVDKLSTQVASQSFALIAGDEDLYTTYTKQRAKLPWVNDMMYMLGAGRIVSDGARRFWYQGVDGEILLKNTKLPALVQAIDATSAFVLWDGHAGELLSVHSQWGLISC